MFIEEKLKIEKILIFLDLIILFLVFTFPHIIKSKSWRDYFIIFFIVTIPEIFFRKMDSCKKFMGKENRFSFIMCLREKKLKELFDEIKNEGELGDQKKNSIKKLTENSISMLGILAGITLTITIIALNMKNESTTGSSDTNLEILAISGIITFTLLIFDLALCYSVLAPSIEDWILIKALIRYYYLILFGMMMLGITFIWGIYTGTGFFHWGSQKGKISLLLLGVFLFVLYLFSYSFRIPFKKEKKAKKSKK